jgi:hypothetical protein
MIIEKSIEPSLSAIVKIMLRLRLLTKTHLFIWIRANQAKKLEHQITDNYII